MRSAVMLVVCVSAVSAAPVPKDFKKPDDKTLLVGKWQVARANVNGQEVAKYSPEHTVTFDADGTCRFQYPTIKIPDQVNGWVIDPTATPKSLAFKRENAAKPDLARAYLFRDGRLVMAIPTNGIPLTSVDPGPGVIVIEYKRADAK